MRNLILGIVLLLSLNAFSQTKDKTSAINDYLRSTVKLSNKLIVNNKNQSVVNADIMEAGLSVNIGDKYNDAPIFSSYFLKVGAKFTAFESNNSMLSSPEFIESLKQNKFRLKTEENGIAFQTLLCLMDNYKPLGFFKVDNTWYFKRDKFFDDVTACVVKTDKKGSVISIENHSRLKINIPEVLLGVDKIEAFDKIEKTLTAQDSIYTHNYLIQKADFVFNSAEVELPISIKETSATIYYCDLKSTQTFSDGVESSSRYTFMLMSNNGKYVKFRDGSAVIESTIFVENILKSITIKDEKDAKAFQDVIDVLNPVDNSFRILKKFYLQDGIWFYLRDKRFDDIYGYMVKADEMGSIKFVDYSTITDEAILRFKMRDKEFKVDYKFKLDRPTQNEITVKKGEGLSVEISFDAAMVNAKGAWILTRFDGRDMGMRASTNMKSPFRDGITGGALENPHHTVEYFLLKNGVEDTEDALGVVKIEITVE